MPLQPKIFPPDTSKLYLLYNNSAAGENFDKFSPKDEEECTKFAIIG